MGHVPGACIGAQAGAGMHDSWDKGVLHSPGGSSRVGRSSHCVGRGEHASVPDCNAGCDKQQISLMASIECFKHAQHCIS